MLFGGNGQVRHLLSSGEEGRQFFRVLLADKALVGSTRQATARYTPDRQMPTPPPPSIHVSLPPLPLPMITNPSSVCLPTPRQRFSNPPPTLSSICKKARKRCRSSPHKRLLVGCNSPFTRLAEHLTALRAWFGQCLPGENSTCPVCAF